MAKLSRIFQILFGQNGDQSHFEQFGARKSTGTGNFTKDPNTIQALSAFITNGWPDAVNPTNNAPFLEDMNALHYLIFYQLCNIFQDGIPAWNISTTYFTGSIVRKDGTSEQYGSLVDNNTGNALPSQADNASWHYLNPTNNPPGMMSDFGGTSAPFGWLLCDGSIYAQGSFPALFSAIGSNWNIGGEGAGNFRVPDIRGRSTIGAGTGTGLSPRVLATLLGEENHILTPAECSQLAHLHSIAHRHLTAFGLTGSQIFAPATSGPNSWPYGTQSQNFAWWVQGVAGVGGAAPHDYFNTSDPSNSNSGAAAYDGSGTTPSAHNNMQPNAVVTKIIKI